MLTRHKKFCLIMALVLTVTLLPTLSYSQEEPPTPDYAYIPNMGDASVSKVDLNAETPEIVAKYFTAPRSGETGSWGDLFGDNVDDLTAIAPVGWRTSRLAMDSFGNAWALNTGADAGVAATTVQGSVAMILGDVSGLTNTSSGNVALPFGDELGDEEAVEVFPIGDRGDVPRCINFSDDGNIWIGFHKASEKYGYFQEYEFDYDTLDLTEVGPRIYGSAEFEEGTEDPLPTFDIAPYNATIDGNGTLWFVSYGSSRVNRNGGTYGSTNGVYSFDIDDPITTFTRHYESNVEGGIVGPMDSGYGILVDDSDLGNVIVYVTIMDTAGGATPGLYIKTGESNFIKENIALSAPRGMAFDEDGVLWIANSGNGSVTRFDPLGSVPTANFTAFGSVPVGVAMDNFGRMWVIVRDSNKMVGFDPRDPDTRTTILGFNQPYAYGEFVAPPAPRYCIEGTKLEDFWTGDKTREALEGWSIYLYNRILEPVEVPGVATEGLLASTMTDENGDYKFCELLAGTYYVYEMFDDCYGPYLPASGMRTVTLPADGNEGNAVDQDFVNRRGKIQGIKYKDTLGTGAVLEGWEILLYKGEPAVGEPNKLDAFAWTTTDSSGYYMFDKLCPDTYYVYELLKDGWVQTHPSDGFWEVELAAGVRATGKHFVNEEEAYDLCGFKYGLDWNGFMMDTWPTDKPLDGWTIILERFEDDAWVYVDEDETVGGKYCFTDLPAGEYRLSEEFGDEVNGFWMMDGKYWLQVGPEDYHEVTLLGDETMDEEGPFHDFYNLCHTDETAWMFGDLRFIEDLGLTSNNWGWSLSLGTLTVEDIGQIAHEPIYAGAGQGDITKGYLVGYVDLFWDGYEVTWDFDYEDGVVVVDPKIWIGNTELPLDKKGVMTNAPGKLIVDPNVDYGEPTFIAIHFEAYVPCGYSHPEMTE